MNMIKDSNSLCKNEHKFTFKNQKTGLYFFDSVLLRCQKVNIVVTCVIP